MLAIIRIFFFALISYAAAGQEVKLMKSTMAASAGGIVNFVPGSVSINHTIGQSSSINQLSSGALHLLQGFQHPFFIAGNSYNSHTVSISIYPNPSQGKISIRWHNDIADDVVWLDVVDMHGKRVVKILLQRKGQEVQFDASSLPKAAYILQLTGTRGDFATHKLILI